MEHVHSQQLQASDSFKQCFPPNGEKLTEIYSSTTVFVKTKGLKQKCFDFNKYNLHSTHIIEYAVQLSTRRPCPIKPVCLLLESENFRT